MKRSETSKSELEKRLEERAAREAADAEAAPGASPDDAVEEELEAVDEQTAALSDEIDHWKDQVLRARAEFDNYRRRVARDAEKARQAAAGDIVKAMLPVLDHLELALQHSGDASEPLAEGVQMVLNQMLDVLGRHGVEPIPALGEPFDPYVHEAVMRQPSTEYPADVVCQEFQRGYKLGGVVLRPSKVVVSAGSDEDAPEAPNA